MNRFLALLIILFFSVTPVKGEIKQDIKVRLFSSYGGKSAIFSAKNGSYYILSQDQFGNILDTVSVLNSKGQNRLIYVWLSSGKVVVKKNGVILGKFKSINLKSVDNKSSFSIKYSTRKERVYDGSLQIKPYRNILELINDVNMTSYVAGVVESEIGSKGNLESYKVQAILVRTYALKNINKFIDKGYNLTDDVRSQVYFSKSHFSSNSREILKAVRLTKDMVIVSGNSKIIDPLFHANSGGQTVKSSDVWSLELPYLQSVKDPYSSIAKSPSAFWKKEISADKYLSYFYKMAPKYRHSKSYMNAVLSFSQKNRKASFKYKDVEIPLKEIRAKFNLRSTYFSVHKKGSKVILYGKGYGHGVGLSQIGAINMVKKGYTYDQIIKFYYKGVHIVNINDSIVTLRQTIIKKV